MQFFKLLMSSFILALCLNNPSNSAQEKRVHLSTSPTQGIVVKNILKLYLKITYFKAEKFANMI